MTSAVVVAHKDDDSLRAFLIKVPRIKMVEIKIKLKIME